MISSTRALERLLACCACLALGSAVLSSCGSEFSGPGETLRVVTAPLDPAFLGEPYSATLRVVGGLTPYTFAVSQGALPPGLSLQGAALRGTPTQEGAYSFTVTVSDGNLSRTFAEYQLSVSTPPPASLSLNVPNTDIQRSVTLRGSVSEARELEGLRTLLRWDPALFQLVPGSVSVTSERYALFFQDAPGQLQLDVAVLGSSLSGERTLFSFALQPLQTTTLALEVATEFVGARGHAFEERTEGVPSSLSEAAPEPDDDPLDDDGPGDPLDDDDFDGELDDDFDPGRTE